MAGSESETVRTAENVLALGQKRNLLLIIRESGAIFCREGLSYVKDLAR
jgi:hypothetical protein